MTYVIGTKRNGITSIISDTRVSFGKDSLDGQNTALKTGLLFPGCIYGASGNADIIRDFITSCKKELTGCYRLDEFWKLFISYFSDYSTSHDEHFQLVLSSRHTGIPRLYFLDSKTQYVTEVEDFISIGSGKNIFDNDFKEMYADRGDLISNILEKYDAPQYFYPYIYCLWFMERSQGIEVSVLEKYDVGGYFHSTFQTKDGESRQYPAVYVLSESCTFNRTIYSHIYRIAFIEASLVIDCPIKNERSIILDTAAWPKIKHYDKKQIENYMKKINEDAEKQPFYNFCGFGFVNPSKRYSYGIHITNKNDYVVTKNGEINKKFKQLIESNFSHS